MANKYYIFLLLFVFGAADADSYLSVVQKRSQQTVDHQPSPHVPMQTANYDVADTDTTINFALGKRWGMWLGELGIGELGRRVSRNHGAIQGRASPCCDITQVIETYYAYAGGGRALPITKSVDVFAILGAAYVYATNHEFGANEHGPGQDNKTKTHELRPIFLAGAKYSASKDLTLRFDYIVVRQVAKSYWTDSSTVKAVGFGFEFAY